MTVTFKLFCLVYLALAATQFNSLKEMAKKEVAELNQNGKTPYYILLAFYAIACPAADFISWIKQGFKPQ